MALTYQQLLTAVPLVLRAGNVPNIVGDAGIGKSALVEEVARPALYNRGQLEREGGFGDPSAAPDE